MRRRTHGVLSSETGATHFSVAPVWGLSLDPHTTTSFLQEPLEVPAPVLPCGYGSLRTSGSPSVFSTGPFQAASCPKWLEIWRSEDTHPAASGGESPGPRMPQGNTTPRRHGLDRNSLSGFLRVARTSSPRDPVALAPFRHFVLGFVFVFHGLLSTLSEDPGSRDIQLR